MTDVATSQQVMSLLPCNPSSRGVAPDRRAALELRKAQLRTAPLWSESASRPDQLFTLSLVSTETGEGQFAALDVKSGRVIGSLHKHHRAKEFLGFLRKIDGEVPVDLDVHLILDNYQTHKVPAVKRWLVRHPRFHLHFTPTYSSWMNLVERWFAALTDKALRRAAHRSVKRLNDAIKLYIEVNNENPKPLVWTKTADEILASIARFCKRTSGAGH